MSGFNNMHLLPSDIARLVLGYLKDKGLKKTLVAFLQESPDLSEYWRVLNSGCMPTTTVMGHTLQTILEEYTSLSVRVKALNAKLSQSSNGVPVSIGQNTNDNRMATSLEQIDIKDVLESHRKAELDRNRRNMRQRARRRNDSHGKKHTPKSEIAIEVSLRQTEASLSQVSHQGETSQTNNPSQAIGRSHLKSPRESDNLNKSSETEDLDDDFEFDSLDRLLADTKLHEKLAESINKALKRGQVVVLDQLTTPPASTKKNTNQSKEGAGNDQNEENAQKDTSTVVDDIISMTADEPGLEQLLSLFQFQPETTPKSSHPSEIDNQVKSAALYIPEVGSKELLSKCSLTTQNNNSGHNSLLPPHGEISDTQNNGDIDISAKHFTPTTDTETVTNNSEHFTQSSEMPNNPSISTSVLHHDKQNVQSVLKHESSDESNSKQMVEENHDGKNKSKSSTLLSKGADLLLDVSPQQEPPLIKLTNPAQNFKKPRVKRCPKKLFKEGDSNQILNHGVLSDKQGDNENNHVSLSSPVKEIANCNTVVDTLVNLKEAGQCTEKPSLTDSKGPECSAIKQDVDEDSVMETLPSHQSTNSPEKAPVIKNKKGSNDLKRDKDNFFETTNSPLKAPTLKNDRGDDETKKEKDDISESFVTVGSSEIPSHTGSHPQALSCPVMTTASNISSSSQCSPILSPHKTSPNKYSTNFESKSPSKHVTPQFGMEDNSHSVFSLIDKCTAEIIGEAYVPRHTSTQINVNNEDRETVDEDDKSDRYVEQPQEINLDQSENIESFEKSEKSTNIESSKENKGRKKFSDKEEANKELDATENEVSKRNISDEIPLLEPKVESHDSPMDDGNDGYQSDSSFDEKISTPNAVYVKPVNFNGTSTRERNYQMVDTCLQDILGKIRVSNNEAKSDASGEVKEGSDDNHEQDELTKELKSHDNDEESHSNINSGNCADDGTDTEERESSSLELIGSKLTKHSFHVAEGLQDYSATISTPFSTKDVVNTDNSPRKLVESNMKISDSASMPAAFPSSLRERCSVIDHHKMNDCYPPYSPPVSKFHLKSKENFSPSMSSRKVIACNIAHSPFIPSHMKRKGPSRRITPTEVSFSTPSPLGLMSPSSPAEFIIDLNHSPSQSNILAKESKTNSLKESVKGGEDSKEKTQVGSEVKSLGCGKRNDNSNLMSEKEMNINLEKPLENMNDFATSSDGDCNTMNRPLPSSPSERKPRRIVPTLLSKSVSKVGSDSLFSSSSCSQNGSMTHQDESKIVSSSSDPTSPHSEEEAFRILKHFIFKSYTKPQPNQEITSSDFTNIRNFSTPLRKCGCAIRDVCTHGTRVRHASTPMRKCGCSSRDVCPHIKGKGRKLLKRHSTTFLKNKAKEKPTTVTSNKSNDTGKVCVTNINGVICDSSSKDEANGQDNNGSDQAAESSRSNGAFVAVGVVCKEVNDPPKEIQNYASNKEGNDEIDKAGDTSNDNGTCKENISEDKCNLCEKANSIAEESETEQIVSTQTKTCNMSQTISPNGNGNAEENSDSDIVKDKNPESENKGNSQSSNESATSGRQSIDIDHHETISLAAPYFPELSNTFDFFKLKKDAETEKLDSSKPAAPVSVADGTNREVNTITTPNQNAVEISPMPGTSFDVNQIGNPEEGPASSSCLISQAMQQCGIPFEPSELSMMELSRLQEINYRSSANIQVNSNVQEDVPSTLPHEPTRMQLRSTSRQINSLKSSSTVKSRSKKGSTTLQPQESRLPSLQPSPAPSVSAQPRIILPAQNQPLLQSDVNPSPMTPGSVAYFSLPNQPPIPFTILADGTVIVLSPQLNNTQSPLPHSSNHLPPLLPLPSPLPRPMQSLTSNVTQPIPVQSHPGINPNNNKKSVISKSNSSLSSLNTKKIDSSTTTASKEKKKDLKREKKRESLSSKDSKEKQKASESCTESLQKVALRRKFEDNSSSPKKVSVSTYFQKPKKSVKRKLSLASKTPHTIKNNDKQIDEHSSIRHSTQTNTDRECNNKSVSLEEELNSAILGITQEVDCGGGESRKEISTIQDLLSIDKTSCNTVVSNEMKESLEDGKTLNADELFTTQSSEINVNDETQRATDALALLNGDSPVKTRYLVQSSNFPETQDKLSPSKHPNKGKDTMGLKEAEHSMKENQVVISPIKRSTDSHCPLYVANGNEISEVAYMSPQKEKILTTLRLKKKDRSVSFCSPTKEDSVKGKKSPLHAKESASDDYSETASKEIESSSHETESGSSYRTKFHSTPLDEAFFDNIESMAEVGDDDGDELLKAKLDNERAIESKKGDDDFVSPCASPKKTGASRKKLKRKSFSDILRSVSLQFKNVNTSPKKRRQAISSDDEDSVYCSPVRTRRRRKVSRISDTSSDLSDSDSSWEEIVESSISYSKVIQDKTISITVSDDGDVIRDVSDSSISPSRRKVTRREKRQQHNDLREEKVQENHSGELFSKQSKEKETSSVSVERKSININQQRDQNINIKDDQTNATNGYSQQRPISSKEINDIRKNKIMSEARSPIFVSSSGKDSAININKNNRKRKAETQSSETILKSKRERRDQLSDKTYQGLPILEKQEKRETKGFEDHRNLFNDIASLSNQDLKTSKLPSRDDLRENGLELLSSVALDDRKLKKSNNDLQTQKAATQNLDDEIDSTPVISKSASSVPTPSQISSPTVESLQSSIVSNDTVPSSLNENNTPSASTLFDRSISQPASSPDVSISSSQLSTGSATKSITKKKINKLISKLYKTPPPPTDS